MQVWFPEIVNRSSGDSSGSSSTVCEILETSFQRQSMFQNSTTALTDTMEICDDKISAKTYIDNITLGCTFLVGFIVQGLLLNPLGQKNILLITLAVPVLSGILLHFITDTIGVLILFCLYIMMPGLSVSVICGVLVDLMPTQLRAKAVSVVFTLGRLGIIVATILLGVMLEPICNTTFAVFTGVLFGAFKLTSIGLTLLMIAIVAILMNPLERVIDWQLALKPGTLFYWLWLRPPIDVFITIKMFNITNAAAYLSGADDRIHLEEIGPYVFQEFLENTEVRLNDNNNTLTFVPKRWVKFVPERSKGDPKMDRIVTANLPYLGITTVATSYSYFVGYAMSALARTLNTSAIVNKSVHEYLWGYDDPLVSLAHKLLPSIFDFEHFGVMERILAEGRNVVNINLPKKMDSTSVDPDKQNIQAREFSVNTFNGSPGLKQWNYREGGKNTQCNTLRGIYDGTLFPRDIKKEDTLHLYRKAFCRTLPIRFSHETKINGIDGYAFKMAEDVFYSRLDDPETACLCKGKKCLKRGLSSVEPCYYNIPLAISFPHFFNGDPTLLEPFEGLAPNKEIHDSEVIVQPRLGIPMRVQSRFQVNMLIGDVRHDRDLARLRNIVMPILWATIGIDNLQTFIQWILIALLKVLPICQLFVILLMAFYGSLQLFKAFKVYFWCTEDIWTQLPDISITKTSQLENGNSTGLTKQDTSSPMKIYPTKTIQSPLSLLTFWRRSSVPCTTASNDSPIMPVTTTAATVRIMETRLQLLRNGTSLPGKRESDVLLLKPTKTARPI